MSARTDPAGEMYKAIQSYLRTQGWEVIVVGPQRIVRQPGALKHNVQLVVDLTAVQRDAKSPGRRKAKAARG
jgi:hypothetical protein